MNDYISQEEITKWLEEMQLKHPRKADAFGATKIHVNHIPAADVRPVVRGKWIIHKPFDSGRHNCNECIECSVCGTWFGHDCYEISNFCPSCGADMREEQND